MVLTRVAFYIVNRNNIYQLNRNFSCFASSRLYRAAIFFQYHIIVQLEFYIRGSFFRQESQAVLQTFIDSGQAAINLDINSLGLSCRNMPPQDAMGYCHYCLQSARDVMVYYHDCSPSALYLSQM